MEFVLLYLGYSDYFRGCSKTPICFPVYDKMSGLEVLEAIAREFEDREDLWNYDGNNSGYAVKDIHEAFGKFYLSYYQEKNCLIPSEIDKEEVQDDDATEVDYEPIYAYFTIARIIPGLFPSFSSLSYE